ncbi:hypothetical protein PVK06_004997 [Gossypium arboreum]|uniref:Reverse transcriptase n=1 Tax=Gossypium arboreum TaxID=29729 RepID=A0ABR0QTF9_GOSAR|nr:hypothetical protein PVK06_004997 [Gossypium arboreum]
MGDFNEIVFSYEKQGDQMRPERNMDDFRAVLDDTDLIDLGYVDNGICGKEVSFLRIISMSALIEGFQGWLGRNYSRIIDLRIAFTLSLITAHYFWKRML